MEADYLDGYDGPGLLDEVGDLEDAQSPSDGDAEAEADGGGAVATTGGSNTSWWEHALNAFFRTEFGQRFEQWLYGVCCAMEHSQMQRTNHVLSKCSRKECTICLHRLNQQPSQRVIRLACGHLFHHKCMLNWARQRTPITCPNCRVQVYSWTRIKWRDNVVRNLHIVDRTRRLHKPDPANLPPPPPPPDQPMPLYQPARRFDHSTLAAFFDEQTDQPGREGERDKGPRLLRRHMEWDRVQIPAHDASPVPSFLSPDPRVPTPPASPGPLLPSRCFHPFFDCSEPHRYADEQEEESHDDAVDTDSRQDGGEDTSSPQQGHQQQDHDHGHDLAAVSIPPPPSFSPPLRPCPLAAMSSCDLSPLRDGDDGQEDDAEGEGEEQREGGGERQGAN
ncbi:unnamed protein product [Vitrella brassicaformis CCMP3155]|uniref:RING-type domain-containing protein n=1 Tax=Vitrella brassicaformis (strain CCMP3155) TaxID=1169540 RepID=A0A0G4GN05_VITBC|nr:unnamed protein product [Vitrella brassicaformis CCMP3155]|eukprot:CEM31579.1 unnamed protein product [Vitrella brassicaformis CCMP3155]